MKIDIDTLNKMVLYQSKMNKNLVYQELRGKKVNIIARFIERG